MLLDVYYIGLYFGSLQVKIKMTFIQKNRRVFITLIMLKGFRLWDEPFYKHSSIFQWYYVYKLEYSKDLHDQAIP